MPGSTCQRELMVLILSLANGLGCTKLLGLVDYAEEFSAAGQEDYRTVVKYARQQPQYDPQRVVVWGFSFTGGHVLTLASDPALNVAASMAQNPYCGRPFPPFQFTRR
ncbi:hypothetical protein DFH06DRAFT_1338103 [Mycena polygramma]|nr:hypothetical protein DFH06DRAFT_1338103 [Mycena polygramma]